MVADRSAPGSRDYATIALLSFVVLLYEVAITRILSVVLWYHFAFLSLSLAMIGLGVPGVWYTLKPPDSRALERSLWTAGLSLPISIAVILQGRNWFPHSVTIPVLGDDGGGLFVVFVSLCILFPMISLGSGICLLLLRADGRKIGRMYGFDLLGAMIGALSIVPLTSLIPTPLVLAAAGFVPLALLLTLRTRQRWLVVIAGGLLASTIGWGTPFEVQHNKLYKELEQFRLLERWTPTARITVFSMSPFKLDQKIPWGWGYGSRYQPSPRKQLWIDQDGSAGTPVEIPNADLSNLDHLFYDVTSVGYQLRPPQRVAVIGAGGGRDVLTALKSGAASVDAIEMNGAIVEALAELLDGTDGNAYARPGVVPIVSEGRSYLSRTEKKYDLIQLSLVDSWAATAAGAYALSENYLYTREAFTVYLERLTDKGLLSVSRYLMGTQQMECTRLALLALEALEQAELEPPEEHLAVVQGNTVGTLLVSHLPWTEKDLDRLREISSERGFQVLWPPLDRLPTETTVRRAIMEGPAFLFRRGYDMSPPTDDKPFFFQALSFFGSSDTSSGIGINEMSVVLLRWLVLGISLLAAALFFSPFLASKRFVRHPGFWRGSGYFAAIGAGFMLVELPWIQRFILYLGHPSYAATVVIGSLLFGASLGSTWAGRMPSISWMSRLGGVLPIGIVALNLSLTNVFDATLGWPLPARICISAALLAPVGFAMGFPFTIGMRHFGDGNKAWFWAINGMMSVLGSVTSLAMSMVIGFSRVALVGVAAYLVSWYLLRRGQPT